MLGFSIVMRYPLWMLLLGIVDSALFTGFAVFSNVFPNGTATVGSTLLFVVFSLLGDWLILVWITGRHELRVDGLDYRTYFGRLKKLDWADVTSIEWQESMKWFKIRTAAGGTFYVSAMMTHLPDFARSVLEGIPAGPVMDGNVRAMLAQIRDGSLPSLF